MKSLVYTGVLTLIVTAAAEYSGHRLESLIIACTGVIMCGIVILFQAIMAISVDLGEMKRKIDDRS